MVNEFFELREKCLLINVYFALKSAVKPICLSFKGLEVLKIVPLEARLP